MQKRNQATNGSAYVAKASSSKSQRPKPYDRPSNPRFSGYKRRPFLGHRRASAETTVEKEVRKPVLPFCINIKDLRKRVDFFKAGQVKHHVPTQHENGGLRKIKDCLKLRKVGEPTLRQISIARKVW